MKHRWRAIWLILLIIISGVIYWLSPRAILIVYGRYPNTVPQQLLAWVATPLPTALPAPEFVEPLPPLEPLLLPTAPPPTLSPTFTPLPIETNSASKEENPVVSSFPTPSPHPPSPTPKPLPTTVRLQNIDIIPQKFNNCGPANLSITMAYHGVSVEQLEIGSVVKPNYDDRNVSPHELVDYVNQHTELAAASFVGGDLSLLKTLMAAGHSVIIEKGLYLNEWEGWMGHYLTLIGYDDEAQEMISLDTFLGPWDGNGRFDSYGSIEQFWQQFNYTFIIVYPPADQPIIDGIVGDLRDPEMMWRQAAFTAQQQTHSQPDNPYAWFNLGSSLTELGHLTGNDAFYTNAAAAFDQARTIGLPWRMLWYQFAPYEAYLAVKRAEDVLLLSEAILTSAGGQNVEETYLYRGHAFALLGDETAVQAAYARAESLNSNLQLTITD